MAGPKTIQVYDSVTNSIQEFPANATPSQMQEAMASYRSEWHTNRLTDLRKAGEAQGPRQEAIAAQEIPIGPPAAPTFGSRLWKAATHSELGDEPFRFGALSKSRGGKDATETVSDFVGKQLSRPWIPRIVRNAAGPTAATVSYFPQAVERAVDVGKSMASPLGLVTAGTGGGDLGAIPQILTSLGFTAAGAHELTKPQYGTAEERLRNRLMGGSMVLGGAAGLKGRVPSKFDAMPIRAGMREVIRQTPRPLPAPTRDQVIQGVVESINPKGFEGNAPTLRRDLRDGLDHVVEYANQQRMPMKSQGDLVKASTKMGDTYAAAMRAMLKMIGDRLTGFRGEVPGYGGKTLDSNTTTLEHLYDRLLDLNKLTRPAFSKAGGQMAQQTALTQDQMAAYSAEAQAIRGKLYKEMGQHLGIDPAVIGRINKASGVGKNLAEWFQESIDAHTGKVISAKNAPLELNPVKGASKVISKMRSRFADRQIQRLFDPGMTAFRAPYSPKGALPEMPNLEHLQQYLANVDAARQAKLAARVPAWKKAATKTAD